MTFSAELLGIPTLDPALAATEIVQPVMKWGAVGRSRRMMGTYHFYTHDYKFTGLERRPYLLRDSGTAVAVEPNFSATPEMSPAQVIHAVWRKRTLSRWFQSYGVRVIVDLNLHVECKPEGVGLLGVPVGWAAYATRAHFGVPFSVIESQHEQALNHSGRPLDVWAVFGGGKKIKAACAMRGWAWVPEHMDTTREARRERVKKSRYAVQVGGKESIDRISTREVGGNTTDAGEGRDRGSGP